MTISSMLATMCSMHMQCVLQALHVPLMLWGRRGESCVLPKNKPKCLDKNVDNSNWVNRGLKMELLALGSKKAVRLMQVNTAQFENKVPRARQSASILWAPCHSLWGKKKVTIPYTSITDFKNRSFIFNSNWCIKMQFCLMHIWILPSQKLLSKFTGPICYVV